MNRTFLDSTHLTVYILPFWCLRNLCLFPIDNLLLCTLCFRYIALKEEGLKEERVLLLEGWRDVEAAHVEGDVQSVLDKMPRKIKMRRMAAGSEGAGNDAVWEEYYDYHFPDDKKEIGKSLV